MNTLEHARLFVCAGGGGDVQVRAGAGAVRHRGVQRGGVAGVVDTGMAGHDRAGGDAHQLDHLRAEGHHGPRARLPEGIRGDVHYPADEHSGDGARAADQVAARHTGCAGGDGRARARRDHRPSGGGGDAGVGLQLAVPAARLLGGGHRHDAHHER
eukprot:9477472-Pyramimonas_sp.AAC.1